MMRSTIEFRFVAKLFLFLSVVTCLNIIGGLPTPAFAGNIDPNHKFAWGENVGCINAAPTQGPGVTLTENEVTGFAWSANVGWINLHPNNGGGVNYHGQGVLSGYAWAENAGWLSFSCDNTNSCGNAQYAVTIDPTTKIFTGFAWGENIGWIRFPPSNEVAVPDVVNQTQSAAATTLTNRGLTLGTVTPQASIKIPSGSVVSQTPSACTSAAPGTAVNLAVSNGLPPTFTLVVTRDSSVPSNVILGVQENATIDCGPNGPTCSGAIPFGSGFTIQRLCVGNCPPPAVGLVPVVVATFCNDEAACTVIVQVLAVVTPTNSGGSNSCFASTACRTVNEKPGTVDAARSSSLTIHFLNLTVGGTGTGRVTSNPGGINCPDGNSCGLFGIREGSFVQLFAEAAQGSTFAGWVGCTEQNGTICGVAMVSDPNDPNKRTRPVQALFSSLTPPTFSLTTTINGNGAGTITCSGAGVPANCNGAMPFGTVVTLLGKANPGSSFGGWSGGSCSGIDLCQVTIGPNKTVTATFTTRQLPAKPPLPARRPPPIRQ